MIHHVKTDADDGSEIIEAFDTLEQAELYAAAVGGVVVYKGKDLRRILDDAALVAYIYIWGTKGDDVWFDCDGRPKVRLEEITALNEGRNK